MSKGMLLAICGGVMAFLIGVLAMLLIQQI